jgi:hypothetical protein
LLETLLWYNPLEFAYRIKFQCQGSMQFILDGIGGSLKCHFPFWCSIVCGCQSCRQDRTVLQGMQHFSVCFREVLQCSLYVLPPLLSGPLFLVLNTIHMFVFIRMTIWGGTIINANELGANENKEPCFT